MPNETTDKTLMAYVAAGRELYCYAVARDSGALTLRGSVTLPSNVQYAVPDSTSSYLYVTTSDRSKETSPHGTLHCLVTFRIDKDTGMLHPHGQQQRMPNRPIHMTIDPQDRHVLVAFSDPAHLRVYRIGRDGVAGAEVEQACTPDTGIYPHQIRMVPGKDQAILVVRGNNATPSKKEDPGALKVFRYRDGQLSDGVSVAPGGGYGFGPRHLDFHRSKPWVYVSLERQNKLDVFAFDGDVLSPEPVFSRGTLADPSQTRQRQLTSGIRVHPSGSTVFIVNRADGTAEEMGKEVFTGGENNIAIFRIDPTTGAPELMAHVETNGIHCRNIQFDPSGRLLAASHIKPFYAKRGGEIELVPARLSLFRVAADGMATLLQSHELPAKGRDVFWMGLVQL